MKKLSVFVMGLAMMFTNNVMAQTTTTIDGVVYTLEGETYTLTNGKGVTNPDLVIPSAIEGKPVTKVAASAFFDGSNYSNNLTSLVIPASIESIGNAAFRKCGSLAKITFEAGSKLKAINDLVFCQNSKLKAVVIPASVESIGGNGFGSCPELTTVTFEKGSKLKSIGNQGFGQNMALTEIILPASLETLAASAFNHTGLSKVTFEDGCKLTSIGEYCFVDSPNLKEFTVPSKVTKIDQRAFQNDPALTKVFISAAVETIGKQAFRQCTGLKELIFENGSKLKTVGDEAFTQATALPEVTIPASVETLGTSAFNTCSALKKITFEEGSNLTAIGNFCFNGGLPVEQVNLEACTKLKSIGQNGLQFGEQCTVKYLIIPASVETMTRRCFANFRKAQAILFLGEKSWADYEIVDASDVNGDLFGSNTSGTIYYNQNYTFPESIKFASSDFALSFVGVKNPVGLAGVDEALYSTYTAIADVDFTATSALKAYKAKYDASRHVIVLSEVNSVKKGEAVVLKANDANCYPLTGAETTPEALDGNDLLVSDGAVTGDNETVWALTKKETGVGFYPVASGVVVPKGKAYIRIYDAEAMSKKFVGLDENTSTAINNISGTVKNSETLYTPDAKVAGKNYRGIVITADGKKMIKR